MSNTIGQRTRILAALTPQDITTQRVGPYLDVSGAQRILAAINAAALADTKTVTVQLMQAQSAAGLNAKVLNAAVVMTAPAGGGAVAGNVEAKINDLDHNNGFGFVAVQLLSNNASAVQAAATLILAGNRYNP